MTRAARRASATRRRCTRRGRRGPAASSRRPASRSPRRSAPGPSEVVFTGGGTEADNLAVKGLYWARRSRGPAPAPHPGQRGRAPRRLDAVHWLAEHEGAEVEWLPVDARRPGAPRDAARRRSRADPDVGRPGHRHVGQQRGRHRPAGRRARRGRARVRRPVPLRRGAGVRPAAGRLRRQRARRDDRHRPQDRRPARRRRAAARPRPSTWCRCCTAAARSATCAPAPSTPRRSSGFAAAAEVAVKRQAERAERLAALRDDLVAGCCEAVPDAVLNGDPDLTPAHRLPGNAHFSFPGCEGDALLLLLDARGIECSTGSACSAGVAQPSHVLLAMGVPEDAGPRLAALLPRPHLDRRPTSTRVAEAIGPVVERARRAGRTASRHVRRR